jgi:hypothetical protein
MSNGSFRYQSFKELCKARRNCTWVKDQVVEMKTQN